jgi:hypothetical protein
MFFAGRKVLIDSALSSGVIYYMSLFRFHKEAEMFLLARWQFG